MHLILSKNNDQSTTEVCEWFYSEKVDFNRLNVDVKSSDIIKFSKEIELNNNIDKEPERVNLQDYKSIWYRRHTLVIKDKEKKSEQSLMKKNFCSNRRQEVKTLYEYFNNNLKADKILGNFYKVSMNKLITLQNARNHGIDIPKSKILSNRKDLEKFNAECETGLITKSIYEPIIFIDQDLQCSNITYTMELTQDIIDDLPETFNPSLIQEKIEKEFEIRSFYISEQFYSMAIFSQSNPNTSVDFRHYDSKKPNRTVPYLLPNALEKKIIALMKEENLNNGSIDIIKAKDGRYIFLEINPVGQFGMVSIPCNYNLELKIYNYLTNG